MRALVTGATGFIGRALIAFLQRESVDVTAVVRGVRSDLDARQIVVGDLAQKIDWSSAVAGVDTVFHLAAAVHAGRATSDELPRYRAINRDRTLELYQAANRAGARRFVFASTAKVMNDAKTSDPYTLSKGEAEASLRSVAKDSTTTVAIVRPALVYGPGVKANFFQLIRVIDRGWPLPLGAVHSRRSLVYVENLVNALWWCAVTPSAANGDFFVADGNPIALPDLIRALARLLEREARLFRVPESVLRAGLVLIGRSELSSRLIDSFVVDARALRETGWSPPFEQEAALAKTVEWYRHSRA